MNKITVGFVYEWVRHCSSGREMSDDERTKSRFVIVSGPTYSNDGAQLWKTSAGQKCAVLFWLQHGYIRCYSQNGLNFSGETCHTDVLTRDGFIPARTLEVATHSNIYKVIVWDVDHILGIIKLKDCHTHKYLTVQRVVGHNYRLTDGDKTHYVTSVSVWENS